MLSNLKPSPESSIAGMVYYAVENDINIRVNIKSIRVDPLTITTFNWCKCHQIHKHKLVLNHDQD